MLAAALFAVGGSLILGAIEVFARLGLAQTPPTTVGVHIDWVQLPSGQDVQVTKGYAYAGIVSIKKTRTKTDIAAFLLKRGLSISDYAEQGQRPDIPVDPDPDYKTVTLMTAVAVASDGTIPWQMPALLSGRDHAIIVWAGTPSGSGLPPEPPAPPTPVWPYVVGAVVVVGCGLTVWEVYRRETSKRRGA